MTTRAELTVALAQNRQGRVQIAADLVVEWIPLLLEHMLICSKEHDETFEIWTYTGYAPGFQALELGASPPLYQADVTVLPDAPITLAFRKLD